jgi:eukaryotic-like serine/threonine-protein kinase
MRGFELQHPVSASAGSLPQDLQEAAVSRLAFASTVAMILSVVAMAASFLRQPNIGARMGMERPVWLIPLWFAFSLCMLVVARSKRLDLKFKLSAGTGYLVAVCAGFSFFRHSLPYLPEDVLRGFSPVTLAILFYATVVPMPPRRMALAGTLAALTDPIVLGLTIAKGNPSPGPSMWLWLFLPNAVAVGLAIAAARVVFGLGQIVRKARQMGSYKLVERLGAGGMGEVWRAEHATLARPAAVKIMSQSAFGASSPEALGEAVHRFEREAQATAKLSSPHTIDLYDYGVSEDGTFFYAMELLEGMDLEALLAQTGPMEPERVVHLLQGVCHSLRDAHQSGVVHRDIKPANIYVCRKGGEFDFVKVLDFGLARRVDTGGAESRLTIAGEILGTPQYMSPEAIAGQEVDGRADLYSLGCVAYRMLTGHDVFEERGVMQVLAGHLQNAPRDVQDLVAGVPDGLAEIVMRCLAKAPSERPSGSALLMRELEATGLAARWTPERAQEWWNEHTHIPLKDTTPSETVLLCRVPEERGASSA